MEDLREEREKAFNEICKIKKEMLVSGAVFGLDIEQVREDMAENNKAIYALKAKGISKDTLDEINRLYDKNTAMAKMYHVELEYVGLMYVYDHVEFLYYQQKDYNRAMELGEWLRQERSDFFKRTSLSDMSGVFKGTDPSDILLECYIELYGDCDFEDSDLEDSDFEFL